MKYFPTLFTFLLSISLMSCGDDLIEDCSDTITINNMIAEETDQLTDALTAYGLDQSSSNCNGLKDAYGNYIDALKRLQGCADESGQGQEFRDSIAEAEAGLDNIDC